MLLSFFPFFIHFYNRFFIGIDNNKFDIKKILLNFFYYYYFFFFFGCCFSSSLSLHTIVNAKRFYMNYSDVQTRYLLPIDTLVCHRVFFPWFSISCTELITCTGQLCQCQCQGGIYLPSKLFLMKISLMP